MPTGIASLEETYTAASSAFTTKYQTAYEKAEPTYEQVATVVQSISLEQGYGWLEKFPRLKEWIGARQLKALAGHKYTVKNKEFESSVSIGRSEFEDNSYGQYSPIFAEMGREARIYPDDIVYSLLAMGDTELCFDGQPFFDSEHPLGGEQGLASNVFGEAETNAPWYVLDTSRELKPLIWQNRKKPELTAMTNPSDSKVFYDNKVDFGVHARGNAGFGLWQMAAMSKKELNADNFNEVFLSMSTLKDNEGKNLRIMPTLLVVPPSLRVKAHEVIKKEKLAGGESNINFDAVEVMVCPYLA
jgi:phage major head subunit gpT-like protein